MKPDLNPDLTDDKTMFEIYKKITLPDPSADPMAAAEAAERDGDLAFLSKPLEGDELPPASLIERAIAAGPRPVKVAQTGWWRQALAGALTLLAFGSGSYALASGLSPSTETLILETLDTSDGFFPSASGYFADPWQE